MPTYDDVRVGDEIARQVFEIRRVDLVRYAGASGDFNTIHWNERVARGAGLDNVIAHGMFTMAEAARVVTDWVEDPARVLSYSVRFSAPVPVPDDDAGASVTVVGVVDDKLERGRVVIGLTATVADGTSVLSAARAVVSLG